MIDDKATEKLKKRAQDLGLIVNASAGEKQGTIASPTATSKAKQSPAESRKKGSEK
jgi:hypothetical protein